MWARCFSSRRTSPFSAMICKSFRTVVYWVGLRYPMVSWTSRTVLGPRLQRTVRSSSSASVGRGGSGVCSGIYEEVTTNLFVCQVENGFLAQVAPSKRLLHQLPTADGRTVVLAAARIVRFPGAGCDAQVRTAIGVVGLAAALGLDQTLPHIVVFRSADHILGLGRQNALNLLLRVIDPLSVHGVRAKHPGSQTRFAALQRLQLLEDADRAVRVVSRRIHVLHAQIVGLGLVGPAETGEQRLDPHGRSLSHCIARPAAQDHAQRQAQNAGDLALGGAAGQVTGGYVRDLMRHRTRKLVLFGRNLDQPRVDKDEPAGEGKCVG